LPAYVMGECLEDDWHGDSGYRNARYEHAEAQHLRDKLRDFNTK
jgi:hypothetical protein